MKWRIKSAAPEDSRLRKWGDYHFARSLARHLRRLGQDVEVDHRSHWTPSQPCDVVLVLRGKQELGPDRQPGAVHVLWNISHPTAVSLDEYRSYDLVLVASKKREVWLRNRIDVPLHALLQCTDTDLFFERFPGPGEARRDIVFVGNNREPSRDGILWAVEAGVPVRIWGRGWEGLVPSRHIVADFLPNDALGDLYSFSRVTLNDHWPDMKEWGFVNNRVFDALACGLPVISDGHAALEEIFPEEILYYHDAESLRLAVERCLLSYPKVEQGTREAMKRVKAEFSFAARAEELLAFVESLLR